jgi:hypothetical protein
MLLGCAACTACEEDAAGSVAGIFIDAPVCTYDVSVCGVCMQRCMWHACCAVDGGDVYACRPEPGSAAVT